MKCAIEGCAAAAGRRHAGRGHCGQAAGRADLARSSRSYGDRRRAGLRARPRARGGDAGRDRKDRGRRRRRGRPRGDARRSRAIQGQEGRRPSCAAAISTRICSPTCWSATSSARAASPAFDVAAHDQPGALAAITAKVDEAGVNIIEINHSRIFTRAAGQGHGDRGRMRGPRRQGDRRCRRATRSRRFPRRARVARLAAASQRVTLNPSRRGTVPDLNPV